MNYKHILLLFTGIFLLSACADREEDIVREENITSQQIETAKKEVFSEDAGILKRIQRTEFKKELSVPGITLIDLRTPKELEETGIIEGAKNIDFYASDFQNKLNTLDKDKKYLIYCRSGNRSSQTLEKMKSL